MRTILTAAILCLATIAHALEPSGVMVYFPIAHSAKDESRRNVKYDIENPGGWCRFVASEVEPVLALGVKTIMLHNPGGHRFSEGHMRFEQFSNARAEGLDYVNDFAAAFRPLRLRGIDVIAYVGSPDDIEGLLDSNGKRDRDEVLDDNDAWQKHNPAAMADVRRSVLREVKHIRQADCRLGLDAVTEQGIGSLSYWLAKREADAGRRPIVEMSAQLHDRHWWAADFDQLILYRSMRPRQIEGTSDIFKRDWPQLGGAEWYAGTTYVLFRSTMNFTAGDMAGQKFSLWRDATPVVGWWNDIKDRDSRRKINPVFPPVVLRKLIEQNLLEKLKG